MTVSLSDYRRHLAGRRLEATQPVISILALAVVFTHDRRRRTERTFTAPAGIPPVDPPYLLSMHLCIHCHALLFDTPLIERATNAIFPPLCQRRLPQQISSLNQFLMPRCKNKGSEFAHNDDKA
uniref:Uncharacterized protein n=1 Tax=Plectus sambesii TaxID=2011161 RepID=A0A914WB81_9BILA